MSLFSDFVTTMKAASAKRICKIQILDGLENVVSEITRDLISGDLQMSDNLGARRNCNLSLDNSKGLYTPDPEKLFWINSKIKVFSGHIVNGEPYYVSRGIFVTGEPEVTSKLSDKSMSVQLYDKWVLLENPLKNDYIIPVGTSIQAAIKGVFQEAGEVKVPIIYPTNEISPYTLIVSAGETFADILIKLSQMLSYTCYFDNDGFPRFEPQPDYLTKGVVWEFKTTEVNYLGSSRRFEFSKVKNFIKIFKELSSIICSKQLNR